MSHGRIKSIAPEQVEAIQLNTTTKEDIIKELGEPQQKIYKPYGVEIYIYEHGLKKSIGIPFLITLGRSGGGGQKLMITFRDGIVVDYKYTIDQRNLLD